MALYLAHAHGGNTHERVRALKVELERIGWSCWFDEDRLLLGQSVDVCMADGIRGADAVCMCLTTRFLEKINRSDLGDNCAKEWALAFQLHKPLIPLIMDPVLLDPRAWPCGVLSMGLGTALWLDACGDAREVAQVLSHKLQRLGLRSTTRPRRTTGPRAQWCRRRPPRRAGARVQTIIYV
jgi:hypothetical protein